MNTSNNKKALLVGNGVNLLDEQQSFSWGDLLTALKNRFDIKVDLDNVFKPFPLAFDEMQHLKGGSNHFEDKIKNLKQAISRTIREQLYGKRGYNQFHQALMNLPYNDYLTTNYDYSLELSYLPNFYDVKRSLAQDNLERKHSLKRHYLLDNDKKVWHIHGELYDSRKLSSHSRLYPEESLMIGYEHYSAYLSTIQTNINGKRGTQKVESQSLSVRLQNQTPSPFWLDIFFTHNLDIIGQALDFSENHLWWLLNLRAKLIKTNHLAGESGRSEVYVNNSIRFFYPVLNNDEIININEINNLNRILDKLNSAKKAKAIAEVLKAFRVEPVPIECDTYQEFYSKFIENDFNRNQ
jgi:hypothetical protein